MACQIEAEQVVPLVVYRRFGRVEVLHVSFLHRAPAERHHVPREVPDWEHHPVSESVVDGALRLVLGEQPAREQEGRGESFRGQMPFERVPSIRREADLELRDGPLADPARSKVRARDLSFGTLQEDVMVELGRRKVSAQVRLALRRSTRPRLGNLYACFTSQQLGRVEKLNVFAQHHELEGIASRLASEAVEQSLGVIDVERWSLLGMEGTESSVLPTDPLERYGLGNQGDDVDSGSHFVDKVWCKRACQGPTLRVAPRRPNGGFVRLDLSAA